MERYEMADVNMIVQGGIGVSYIASVVYLVKVVIAPLASTVKALAEGQRELFVSRNGHEAKITAIETIHHIKGCDLPKKGT